MSALGSFTFINMCSRSESVADLKAARVEKAGVCKRMSRSGREQQTAGMEVHAGGGRKSHSSSHVRNGSQHFDPITRFILTHSPLIGCCIIAPFNG